METKFTILSHACLLLERGNTKIIIDPWLIGACYWGSWWNFPEPQLNPQLLQEVDYVIISHVHWDHWHGLSLKKFFKGCHYIVPDEYQHRSYEDLKKLNIGPITQVKHAHTLALEDNIKITCYNFGLFLNDSAIVIETPECKLLDANDCKITGLPLKHIMKKHGHFDFALRSHSSANYRACITAGDDYQTDDPEHYARSFQLFMNKVKPTYAIPFASNSCHLHKDTFKFNTLVTNPLRLQQQIGDNPFPPAQLQIMLPGSSWSSLDGFSLQSTDCFNNVEEHLTTYQQRKMPVIENLYKKERALKLDERAITRHCEHLKSIPKIFRKKIAAHSLAYCVRHIDGDKQYYTVDLIDCKITTCDENTYLKSDVRFDWPLQVLRDSIYKKMYHHAFISKRVLFYVPNATLLKPLQIMIDSLERIELGVFPLRAAYFWDMFKSYCVRYREIVVYFAAFYYAKIKKMPLYLVEERIARGKVKKSREP
jgi:UDP-MurNAc hydroxylase